MPTELCITQLYHDSIGPTWALVSESSQKYLLNLRASLNPVLLKKCSEKFLASVHNIFQQKIQPEQLNYLAEAVAHLLSMGYYRSSFLDENESITHLLVLCDASGMKHLVLIGQEAQFLLEELRILLENIASYTVLPHLFILPPGIEMGIEAAFLLDQIHNNVGSETFLQHLLPPCHKGSFKISLEDFVRFRFGLLTPENADLTLIQENHLPPLLAIPDYYSDFDFKNILQTLLNSSGLSFPRSQSFLHFSVESTPVRLLRECLDEVIAQEQNPGKKAMIATCAIVAREWEQSPERTYTKIKNFLSYYDIELNSCLPKDLQHNEHTELTVAMKEARTIELSAQQIISILESCTTSFQNNQSAIEKQPVKNKSVRVASNLF